MSNMYAFLTFVVSFKHACFDILFIVIELFAGVFFFFFFFTMELLISVLF